MDALKPRIVPKRIPTYTLPGIAVQFYKAPTVKFEKRIQTNEKNYKYIPIDTMISPSVAAHKYRKGSIERRIFDIAESADIHLVNWYFENRNYYFFFYANTQDKIDKFKKSITALISSFAPNWRL